MKAAPLPSEEPRRLEALPRARARVLLAEDNPVNQKVAVRMLESLDHRVDVVANGLEAVAAARRVAYDVILMDCQMPEMDGFAATREIRRVEADARHTPIIAMSANTMAGNRDRCLGSGMDDWVAKPILARSLHATLARWIGREEPPDWRAETATTDEPDDGVDETMLDEILQYAGSGGATLVRELVQLFFEEAPGRLECLSAGLAANQPEAVTRAAHALKGSAGNLGAVRAAALCEELEKRGRQDALGGGEHLVVVLQRELERLRGIFARRVARLPVG